MNKPSVRLRVLRRRLQCRTAPTSQTASANKSTDITSYSLEDRTIGGTDKHLLNPGQPVVRNEHERFDSDNSIGGLAVSTVAWIQGFP